MGFFSSLFGSKNTKGASKSNSAPKATQVKTTKSQKLILLCFADKYKVDGTSYPQSLSTKFGIPFVKQEYLTLYSEGYIRESTNKESLCHLKVAELKTIASDIGISGAGKKEELCNRIIDNVTDEALVNYNLDHYWMLTDKGKEELQNNPYIELYTGPHKYRLMEIGLGYEKIASELNGISPNRYRDVVWKNLNEMSVNSYASAMKTTNFFQYREVLRTMGLFLEEEGKYKEGLYQYLRCVYYNVNFKAVTSALVNYKMFKKMKDASDAFMLDAEIMPYEIDDLTRLIDECGFKSKEFDAFMLDSFQKERDTGIFNPQEMVEFVNHGLRKHTGKQRTMFDTNFKKKMRIR